LAINISYTITSSIISVGLFYYTKPKQMKHRIIDDNNLPTNITELVIADKVSYRGCGFGIDGFMLKVKGIRKEFCISHARLKELCTIKTIPFVAPYRKESRY